MSRTAVKNKVASPNRRAAVSPAVSEALAKQRTMPCRNVPHCIARAKHGSSSESWENTHSYQMKHWYSTSFVPKEEERHKPLYSRYTLTESVRYSMGFYVWFRASNFFQLERKVRSECISNVRTYDLRQLQIFRVPAMKLKDKMGNQKNVVMLKYCNTGAMHDVALNRNVPRP